METITVNILLGFSVIIVGMAVSAVIFRKKKFIDLDKKHEMSEELIGNAKKEADKIKEETAIRAKTSKENLEKEILTREERIKKMEEILKNKNLNLEKKETRNNEIKLKLAAYKEETQGIQEATKRLEIESRDKLSEKTGQNPRELKEQLLKKQETELKTEEEEKLAKSEEDHKENAEKIAKKILITTMQRLCSPTSVESKVVIIKVPKDNLKGKIFGQNGKNIEEIEKALEVDVVFNDLPNTISISCFNLVHRRIAQKAIEKLIKVRGEIDPRLVQKALKEAAEDTDKELYEIGKNAIDKMGLKITNKELIKTIGRLQFRTSYGQNIMKHAMEVSWVASMLASELGVDVNICRVSGFLHDLGKAIDQDPNIQDSHDFLTKELMTKYGFSDAEIHAAWTHHEAEPALTPEALLVKAADAVSAGRPGARLESIDKYIERIQMLEQTADSFQGVKRSFAISAGRELRVILDPEAVNDEIMPALAHDMAQKIQNELSYPGKVKVNLIRKVKFVETAK